MIALTGSVRSGKAVARAAAESLKRVHLELGGKAPVVIFAGRRPGRRGDRAARRRLLELRPGVRRRLPRAGPRVGGRRVRRAARQGGLHDGRRRARRGRRRRDRAADLEGPLRPGHRLPGASRGRRASAPPIGGGALEGAGYFVAPTVLVDVPGRRRVRPRGDLRPGRHRRDLHRRGRGDRPAPTPCPTACRPRSGPNDARRSHDVAAQAGRRHGLGQRPPGARQRGARGAGSRAPATVATCRSTRSTTTPAPSTSCTTWRAERSGGTRWTARGTGTDVAVDRREVVALCLTALDAAGAATAGGRPAHRDGPLRRGPRQGRRRGSAPARPRRRPGGRPPRRSGRPAAGPPLSCRHHLRRPRRDRADRLRRELRRPRAGCATLRPGRLRASRERSPADRSAGSSNAWPTPGSSRSPPRSRRPCSPPGRAPAGSSAPTRWRTRCPAPGRAPLTVDQASSSTAFVSVRDAAAQGTLPARGVGRRRGRPPDDRPRGRPGRRAAALRRLQGREHRPARRAAVLDGGRQLVDGRARRGTGSRSPPSGCSCSPSTTSTVGPGFPERVEEHLERLAEAGLGFPEDPGSGNRQAR